MTEKEYSKQLLKIDPERPDALDRVAELKERDHIESGKDLKDPAVIHDLYEAARKDLKLYMEINDDPLEKINSELRKAGATEAQIYWGLLGDVKLPTFAWLRYKRMAMKLIQYDCMIVYCLSELQMLSKYTDKVDLEEIQRIRKQYRRRFR